MKKTRTSCRAIGEAAENRSYYRRWMRAAAEADAYRALWGEPDDADEPLPAASPPEDKKGHARHMTALRRERERRHG